MRIWALGLCVHMTAFIVLALRDAMPDLAAIVVSETLVSLAYALYLLAISTFFARSLATAALILPPIIMAVAIVLTMGSFRWRFIFSNGVLFAQGFMLAALLLRQTFDHGGRGRNLMLFAIAIVMATALWRIGLSLWLPQHIPTILQASDIQIASYALAFFASILATNGFILMAKEQSDKALHTVAMKDRLTGCWNRIRIEEMGEQELARLTRYGYPVSLMMIDIDHFKLVNDRYGHIVGDAVLRKFGELARATIRTTDVVGRWGGEEFVVILPSCSIQDVLPLAERLRTALEQHAFEGGLTVTASIGISLARSTDTWPQWLNRADAALYSAKNAGRNRTHVEDLVINPNNLVGSISAYRLRWREAYKTANADIDAEHRDIFKTANSLLAMGQDASKADVLAQMEPLLAAVKNHLAHEDRLLQTASNTADAHAHIERHRYLICRADDLIQRFQNDTISVAALFHFIVFEYITQHILIEDRKIADLLHAENVD